MSFFKSSNRKWHNRDRLIFWIGLVVVYIFFFASVKELAAIDSSQPAAPKTRAIMRQVSPVPPATPSVITTSALPLFQAWISKSENSDVPPATTPSFLPNEKVYLYVTFPKLAAGTARVNVNWISPAGKPSSSAEQVISQETSEPASIEFWLSILPNGPVSEIFTGKEYKPQVYGQWQVQVFFNGKPLTTLLFRIQD